MTAPRAPLDQDRPDRKSDGGRSSALTVTSRVQACLCPLSKGALSAPRRPSRRTSSGPRSQPETTARSPCESARQSDRPRSRFGLWATRTCAAAADPAGCGWRRERGPLATLALRGRRPRQRLRRSRLLPEWRRWYDDCARREGPCSAPFRCERPTTPGVHPGRS